MFAIAGSVCTALGDVSLRVGHYKGQTNVQTHHRTCWNLKNTGEQISSLKEGVNGVQSSPYCRSLQVVEFCLCFLSAALCSERDPFLSTLFFNSVAVRTSLY